MTDELTFGSPTITGAHPVAATGSVQLRTQRIESHTEEKRRERVTLENSPCDLYVVLDQISLVRKVYRKYRKQTLPLGYLDHIMALNRRRHDFTKDPGGPQKHCFL